MNRPKFIGATILTVALMLGAAGTTNATTGDECQGWITAAELELAGVEIDGRNADRTRAGLESKLSGASIKLDQYKAKDACVKLMDYIVKLGDLAVAVKPKMSTEDADYLQGSAAGDAKVCVIDLGNLTNDCEPK